MVPYEGRYLYCIIECAERKSFDVVGIGHRNDEVYTVPYRDISAVVSNTPLQQYEANEENALTHMMIIQKVMENYTVLPVRFCTVFKGEETLKRTLAKLYRESKIEIERLRDKIEVGLKVLWHPSSARKYVMENNRRLQAMEESSAKKTRGIAYLMKVELEKAIEDEMNRRSEEFARAIYRELKGLAVEARECRMVGHMILNGAFLMKKDNLAKFGEAANLLRLRYEPSDLQFFLSESWPPYNFVRMRYE